MRLVLGSGGISPGQRLEAWQKDINWLLTEVDEVLYVPYAQANYDRQVEILFEKGFSCGRKLVGIHTKKDPKQAVQDAQAIMVGGGNTFRLVNELYANGLVDVVRERVKQGLPYFGASAGANVTCPTMMTTNDMPIVYPPSFVTFNLVPFQINPHFFGGSFYLKQDDENYIKHLGETREKRIEEYHQLNGNPVIGLYEGGILRIDGQNMQLTYGAAMLFTAGEEAKRIETGTDLSYLLSENRSN